MEDFVREIGQGSSLFLLFGETGVGKSRLLQQLKLRRLQTQTVYMLDFESESTENITGDVKGMTESCTGGEVVIFDHFEAASKREQNQLFESWSIDGRDKNLNMIVCASSTSFNGFRQLAQHFQIEVKSFQLMPCGTREREEYLRFRLYPERPFGELKIPSPVRRLVHRSGGLFSRLSEIVERDGDTIGIRDDRKTSSRMLTITVIMLLILSVSGAGMYYYFVNQPVVLEVVKAAVEPKIKTESVQADPVDQKSTEPKPLGENESKPGSKPDLALNPEPQAKLESQPDPIPVTESKPVPIPEPVQKLEPLAVKDSPDAVELKSEQDRYIASAGNLLQSKLQASLDWVNSSDSNRGTIQIMSIGFDRLDEQSFESYLKDLDDQGIDISELRIFRTKAATLGVYSLIYGDFDNRREASNQINLLPKALGADNPISRTAGSIAREIARNSVN